MASAFRLRQGDDIPSDFREEESDASGGGFHHSIEPGEAEAGPADQKESSSKYEKNYVSVFPRARDAEEQQGNGYCFLCEYTHENAAAEGNLNYGKLVAYVRRNIGKVEYGRLCQYAQVFYNKKLRNSVDDHHRDLEWETDTIEAHFKSHSNDPLASDVHTLDVYQQVCTAMESNALMYIDPCTKKRKVDEKALHMYIKIKTARRELLFAVEKQRRLETDIV